MMRGEIDMLHEVSRDAAEFVEAETTVKTVLASGARTTSRWSSTCGIRC